MKKMMKKFTALAAFAFAAAFGLNAQVQVVAGSSANFYADDNGVWHVVNAAGLGEFRDRCNAGIDYSGKTVCLDASIDLGNAEWEPIGDCWDDGFRGTFDGKGFTVSNFKVTTDQKFVGLFGVAPCCIVTNLTVEGATVIGINSVAAIVGHGDCAHIIGCTARNCTVTAFVKDNDDGDKVGVICGYLCGESRAEVKNCRVENCTITGYRDVGGAVGIANGGAEVYNTTVVNTTVINDRSVNYKGYTTDAAYDVHAIIGEITSTATIGTDNVADNVTVKVANFIAQVGSVKYEDLNDALTAAKTKGSTCELLKDVALSGTWTPVAGFAGTFDGKGYKITGLAVSGAKELGLFASTSGATIKDLTIDGATITGEGSQSYVGVIAGALGVSTVSGVKVLNATINTESKYTGGIAGSSSSSIYGCVVSNCVVTGKDQVGGIVGYQWCNGVWDCTVAKCKVTATEERAGAVIGKLQCSSGNDSHFDANNNTISECEATAPDYAGGFVGQIHGDAATYSIRNNDIDAKLSAGETNPIGVLRPFSEGGINTTFTSALEANITGNCWSDTTLAANSFTYTAVGTGVDPQVINRDNPSVIVDTGDEETNEAKLVTKKSTTAANTTSVEQPVATAIAEQVTVGGKTTTVAEQIEQTTKVEGVKLTTNETVVVEEVALSGAQAVVSAAKVAAVAAENTPFNDKIATAKTVEVKVEVTVTPTAYVAPEAEQTVGTMAFKLEPKATVKIIENNEAVATQVVNVDNDMIDQTQPITVSIFTGFQPVQIVHRDNDGNFIEAFSGDAIDYDATTGIATVAIDHFSTLTAYQEEVVDPLQPEGSVKVTDGFYQNATTYSAATEFYITNLNGLKYFRDLVNENANGSVNAYIAGGFWTLSVDQFYTYCLFDNKTVNLLADIDLNNEEWEPIGNAYDSATNAKLGGKPYFYGRFDGHNHTVSNLKFNNTDYHHISKNSYRYAVGLFGYMLGTNGIQNLTIENVDITGQIYIGALVGHAPSAAITITNCHIRGSIAISGTKRYIGGIAGHAQATFRDCSVEATTDAAGTISASSSGTGGICGYSAEAADNAFAGCVVKNMSITGTSWVGGIAGHAGDGVTITDATLTDVTVTGTSETNVGRLIGLVEEKTAATPRVPQILDTVASNLTATGGAGEVLSAWGTFATAGANGVCIVGKDVKTIDDAAIAEGNVIGGTFESLPDAYVASGYEMVAQGTTPETYVVQVAAPKVCKIGDTEYTSLAAAIADVPTAGETATTIQMIADEAMAYGTTVTIANKNIVLDLNGHTVSGSGNAKGEHYYFISINSGARVEITDTSAGKAGVITMTANPYDSGYGVQSCTIYNNGGTLTLTEGKVENLTEGGLAYAINNSANAWGESIISTFNMTGGTVSAPTGDGALRVYLNAGQDVCENYVNISGGTILDKGIFVDSFTYEALSDKMKGVINVTGGTVNGLIDFKIRNEAVTMNVSGGTFGNSTLRVRKAGDNPYITKLTKAAISISGGAFTFGSDAFVTSGWDADTAKAYSVTGGTYSADPTAWVADGYEAVKSGENWTVSQKKVAEVTIGETTTTYASLSNAFANATSGATVKLLCDVDLAGENWKPVNFCGTFDGNGKTISNLTVTNYNMQYVGFFEEFSGVAKNVTFTGADVSAWPDQGRAGVFTCVADSKYLAPTTISNVTVVASTVRGTQKCAGLVGFIRGLGNGYYDASIDIIDCHVSNVTLLGMTGNGMVQTGGLVGNVGSGTTINIISNTVSNITIEDKAKVKGYDVPETQYACHAFMGVLVNGRIPTESYTWGIAIFDGNTTDQCPESMVVRGRNYSEFIGDYANWDTPISGTKCLPTKLVVDGYEVTLARANVVSSDALTTNTYATLQTAFNAVQEGQTIDVLADNSETITVTNTCSFTFKSNGYTLGSAPSVPEGYAFVNNGDGTCTYGVAAPEIVIHEGGSVTYKGGSASTYSTGNYYALNKAGDFGSTVQSIRTEGDVANVGTSITFTGVRGIDNGASTLKIASMPGGIAVTNNGWVGAINQQSSSNTSGTSDLDVQGIGDISVKSTGAYGAKGIGAYSAKNADISQNKINVSAKSLTAEAEGTAYAIQGTLAGRTTTINIENAVTVKGVGASGKAYGSNLTAATPVGQAEWNFGSFTASSENSLAYGFHCAGGLAANVILGGDMAVIGATYGLGFRLAGSADFDLKGKDDKEINITVSSTSNYGMGADVGNGSSSTAKLNLDVNNFTVTSANAEAYGLYAEASKGAAISGNVKNLSANGGTSAFAIYSEGGAVSLFGCTNITAQGATESYAIYATNCTITLGKVSEPLAINGDIKLFAETTLSFSNAVALAGNVANAGTMTFDLTGATEDTVTLIDYAGSETMDLEKYGTVTLTNADGYTLKVVGNDLVAVKALPVCKIGDTEYATLAAAVAEVKSGETIEILCDFEEPTTTITLPKDVTGVTIKSLGDGTNTVYDLKGFAAANNGLTLKNIEFSQKTQTLDIEGSNITFDGCKFNMRTLTYNEAYALFYPKTGDTRITHLISGSDFLFKDCVFDGESADGKELPNARLLYRPQCTNLTIDGCSFRKAFSAIHYTIVTGTYNVLNSDFDVYCYTMHMGGDTPCSLVCSNCVIRGWTSFSSDPRAGYSATFTDCTFEEGYGYDLVAAYIDTTFKNCSFDAAFNAYAQEVGRTWTFDHCTKNGEEMALAGNTVADVMTAAGFTDSDVWLKSTCVIKPVYVARIVVGDETNRYETLQAALDAAVDGDTVELLCNVALDAPVATGTDEKTLTLDGAGFTVSPSSSWTGGDSAFNFGYAGGGTEASMLTHVYTMKNVTFDGFTGVINVLRSEGSTMTVTNCTFRNCQTTSSSRNAAVVLFTIENAVVDDCTFENNVATTVVDFNTNCGEEGQGRGTFTLANSLVKGNTCSYVGAVYYFDGEGATVRDNTFESNTISGSTSAIVYYGQAGDITGNFFTNNTVSVTGDGKCGVIATGGFDTTGKLFTGNAFVDNTLNPDQSQNTATVYVKGPVDLSANYWNDGEVPEAGIGADYLATKTVTVSSYALDYAVNANGCGVTVTTAPISADVCQNLTTEKKYDDLATAIDEATAGDTIQMIANFTLPSGINTSKSFTLDLNGKTIDGANLYGFVLGGTTTIKDSSGNDSGKITHCTKAGQGDGYGAIKFSGTSFTLEGGCICENTAAGAQGAAIFVSSGNFVMNGGVISNNTNTAGNGGGVNQSNGKFTMNGGKIVYNTSSNRGGGVELGAAGVMEMKGGLIANNTAANQGGGIHLGSGTASLTIAGGEISDNTATTSHGGAIMVEEGTFSSMANCVLSGNTAAAGHGGAVYAGGLTLVSNVTFSANSATKKSGGAMYLTGASTAVEFVDVTVSGNTAPSGSAGGIGLFGSATATFGRNVVIANNTAKWGGGVWIESGTSKLTMTDGLISGNSATAGGGGAVYVKKGTFEMTGGVIDETNIGAYGVGKGIWLFNGTGYVPVLKISGTAVVKASILLDSIQEGTQISGGLFDAQVATKSSSTKNDIKPLVGGVFTDNAKTATVSYVKSSGYSLLPTTKAFVVNDDATTYGEGYFWKIDVPVAASIGTVKYETLQAAVNAVTEGQTIEVLMDNSENLTVSKTCSFTMNSNGCTLSGNVEVAEGNYQFIRTDTGCKFTKTYTIHFLFFDGEPAKTAETELPADMTVYNEKSWDLPVFAADKFNSADYTFVGWTDAETNGVIKEFAAGVITNGATLYAKFDALAKASDSKAIEVKPTEESETKTTIKVTQEWVNNNVEAEDPTKGATAEEINTVLEETDANGLKKWQNYVLGLENETNEVGAVTATVASDAAQVDDVNTIPVVPAVNPKADTGFTVKYELDDVTVAEEPINVISATNIEALVIDVNSVISNKKFKVNVVITPENAATGEKITSTNTIGVLKTAAASKQSLIAVPWESFGASNEVTVAGIVKTANLTKGDKIYVYDEEHDSYFEWKLLADKSWDPISKKIGTKMVSGGPADAHFISRGTAIWIERADTSTPVCFYGQATEAETATSEIAKAEDDEPSWNLVASPSVEDLDLRDGKLNGEGKGAITPANGDMIQLPTSTAPFDYKYITGKGWCYQKIVEFKGKRIPVWTAVGDEQKISAGQGFWYISTDDKDKTIGW